MNSVIETMLSRYAPQNNRDRENAVKEIVQEIALAGFVECKVNCNINIIEERNMYRSS